MNKICIHFMKGYCRNGDKCSKTHDKDLCRNFFFDGHCKRGDTCRFKHTETIVNNGINKKDNNKNRKKRAKNTENFIPSHEAPEMRIVVADPKLKYIIESILPEM